MPFVVDSYNNTVDGDDVLSIGVDVRNYGSQAFSGAAGNLTLIKLYLRKQASPTGNATVRLFSHTAATGFGTDSVPGTQLAISDNVDVNTSVSGSFSWVAFPFSGAQQFLMEGPPTKYCAVLEFAAGDDTNYLLLSCDTSLPAHGGNMAYSQFAVTWTVFGGDALFEVWAEPAAVVNLMGQILT